MLLLTLVVCPATSRSATPSEATPFSYWSIKPWFLTEGKLAAVLFIPFLLGFPTVQPTSTQRQQDCLAPLHTSRISGAVAGEKDHFCKGSLSLSIFFTLLLFFLSYFCLLHYIKNNKKLVYFL